MTNEDLGNFEIRGPIGFSKGIDRFEPRKAVLNFELAEKRFIVTYIRPHKTYIIPISTVRPLMKEHLPRGNIYYIEFDAPNIKWTECFIRDIAVGDMDLIHQCILKLVGLRKSLVKGATSRSTISTKPLVPATPQNSSILSTASSKMTTPKRIVPSLLQGSSTSTTPSLLSSPHRKQRLPPSSPPKLIKRNRCEMIRPKSSQTSSTKDSKSIIPTSFYLEPIVSKSPITTSFHLEPIVSMSPITTTIQSSESSKKTETSEQVKLIVPPGEDPLPDEYNVANFWENLKSNKDLRAGACGEWVKGRDEHLTMDGLLGLRDGEWLSCDIIDAYLNYLCRKTPMHEYNDENDKENELEINKYAPNNIIQFIPTYGFVSFKNKKHIPSKWYWRFRGVQIVLAPAHLHNSHWAMAVADMEKKQIIMMDSLNHGSESYSNKEHMNTVLDILMEVAEQFTECIGTREDWTMLENLDVPQQDNGTDCGIFSLQYARHEIEGRIMEFSQQHIPYYRRLMCKELISSGI